MLYPLCQQYAAHGGKLALIVLQGIAKQQGGTTIMLAPNYMNVALGRKEVP
jgi:hypothetical protein